MVRRRTGIELTVAGAVTAAAAIVGVVVTRELRTDHPVTEERIASEMVGDDEVASCIYDGLKERGIHPDVLDRYLDGSIEIEEDPTEAAGVSEVIAACSSVTLVGPGAPASSDQGDASRSTSDVDDATATTLPPPVVRIDDDGAAEVVEVFSTELVRVDPEIPEAASNRSP